MSTHAKALIIIDNIYNQASKLARKHNLSLKTTNKKKNDNNWDISLKLDDDEPEYRKGFSVTLVAKDGKLTVSRIWSIVTDLSDGAWLQDIRDDLKLEDVETAAVEVMALVDIWLDNNVGLDPKETARKVAGTAFYWSVERDDDMYEYYTDFGGSNWSAEVIDCAGCEGMLYDQNENEVYAITGDNVKEVMLKLEAEFQSRNQTAQ